MSDGGERANGLAREWGLEGRSDARVFAGAKGECREARLGDNFRQEIYRRGIPPPPLRGGLAEW